MSSAAAAAAASSSAPSGASWSSLAHLIVPQRHSSKINRGLLTGHQSVIHADPHEAAALSSQAARAHSEKYHDDILEVDDVSIAFSHTEYWQHAVSRLLSHHIELQQRAACEQHKQRQLDQSEQPVDLARLDSALMTAAERRVDAADAKRQAEARTKRKQAQAAERTERKTKKQRGGKKDAEHAAADQTTQTAANGKPKRSASDGKAAAKTK